MHKLLNPRDVSEKTINRFDAQIIEDSNGCYIWTGYRHNAYGRFIWYDGRNVRAHRAAYAIHFRVDPGELCVLHHCNIPICVNPEHLYLGTHTDNMQDMYKQDRNSSRRGLDAPGSVLSAENVVEIFELYASHRYVLAEIAEMYDVTDMTISGLIRRITYFDVKVPIDLIREAQRSVRSNNCNKF